jgi:hypothetical protein
MGQLTEYCQGKKEHFLAAKLNKKNSDKMASAFSQSWRRRLTIAKDDDDEDKDKAVMPSAAPTLVPTWSPTDYIGAAKDDDDEDKADWSNAPLISPNPTIAPTSAPTAAPTAAPIAVPTAAPPTAVEVEAAMKKTTARVKKEVAEMKKTGGRVTKYHLLHNPGERMKHTLQRESDMLSTAPTLAPTSIPTVLLGASCELCHYLCEDDDLHMHAVEDCKWCTENKCAKDGAPCESGSECSSGLCNGFCGRSLWSCNPDSCDVCPAAKESCCNGIVHHIHYTHTILSSRCVQISFPIL